MKCFFKTAALLIFAFGVSGSALAQATINPRFTKTEVAPANSISLTLTGAVLTSYNILATTNINETFTMIGVTVTDSTGKATYTDPGTLTLRPHRFYRAQKLP